MKKILIIGGGAMGSAFTIPCLENKNDVTITEPYSKRFIKDLSSRRKFHSALKINLPRSLKFRKFSNDLLNEKFDLFVIALSLPGIDFIGKKLKDKKIKTPVLVLTKGLKYLTKSKKILTISENLRRNSGIKNVSVKRCYWGRGVFGYKKYIFNDNWCWSKLKCFVKFISEINFRNEIFNKIF